MVTMTDFESQLRARLADAAEGAPAFTGFDPQRAAESSGQWVDSTRSRRSYRWLAVAAAVAVAAAGVSWWSSGRAGNDGGQANDVPQASCAAELVLAGRVYRGYGPLAREPRPGPRLGTANVPTCDDGQGPAGGGQVEVFTLPGINPDVAIFADGLWVSAGEAVLPASLRDLSRPVLCSGAGESTVAGTLTGIEGPPAAEDYHPRTPYTATVVADEGSGLPLDEYSSVTIRIRVTAATARGRDPSLVRAALAEGNRVSVKVRCAGPRFDAISFALAP